MSQDRAFLTTIFCVGYRTSFSPTDERFQLMEKIFCQKIRWYFSSVGKHRSPPMGFGCGLAALHLGVEFRLNSYG
jgi:hypothetical protein